MKLCYKSISQFPLLIDLPASKSISNRVLTIQALLGEKIKIDNLSKAEDTKVLDRILQSTSHTKNIGIAGTAARFGLAFFATQQEETLLTGEGKMLERPIAPLVDALQELGAEIHYLDKANYLPVKITKPVKLGGKINIEASVSSQFISALMMIAPTLKKGLSIHLKGNIVSKSYIEMTAKIMHHFGINVQLNWKNKLIIIEEQSYQNKPVHIENDWSAASYFYSVLALLKEGSIRLHNLHQNSFQGDQLVSEIFYSLGIHTHINDNEVLLEKTKHRCQYLHYDFTDCPDLAQTTIVCCALLGIGGCFSGMQTLNFKETNRIKAVQKELNKINWELIAYGQNEYELKERFPKSKVELTFETYKDHRMAMSIAPICIIMDEISIEDPAVVQKSFPDFWKEIEKLGISQCPSTN